VSPDVKNHSARLGSWLDSYKNQVKSEDAVTAGQFIQWQDLFVTVDDGSLPVAGYAPIESGVREQARAYPQGVALLCILPPDARPPPEDVKRSVKAALTRVASSISCLTYVIEGTGFKGVAARATLVGMKIFSSRPYPIYVETSVEDALGKVVAHMVDGHLISIEAVMNVIAEARLMWHVPPPPARDHDRDHELSLK
jgi:hypothetical protein